jgi:hypothetical protein
LSSFEDEIIRITVENSIAVRVQPYQFQHIRYEKENEKFLRYTKAADGKPIKVDVSLFHINQILFSLLSLY